MDGDLNTTVTFCYFVTLKFTNKLCAKQSSLTDDVKEHYFLMVCKYIRRYVRTNVGFQKTSLQQHQKNKSLIRIFNYSFHLCTTINIALVHVVYALEVFSECSAQVSNLESGRNVVHALHTC